MTITLTKTKLAIAVLAVVMLVPATAWANHVFNDVPDGAFYADPVEWAFNNGITTGTSATTFSPLDDVTRGESVTFLKRYHDALGSTAGPAGPAGPAGLSYVADFHFTAITAMGTSSPAPAPANYSAIANLTAGRHYVTGDLSVQNADGSNTGTVVCQTYINGVGQPTKSVQSLIADGFATLAINNTFTLAADGSTAIEFRCYREGSSTSMNYWFANLTIFTVS